MDGLSTFGGYSGLNDRILGRAVVYASLIAVRAGECIFAETKVKIKGK